MDAELNSLVIRPASEADLPQLTSLYNHYILNTAITFDIEPMTVEQRRHWLSHYRAEGPHRLWVAMRGETLLGYASSGPIRPKAAYSTSIETSVYCLEGHTGKGVGKKLYDRLFSDLRGEDLHRAYAGITLPNDASVGLHESFGFRRVGAYSEMGRKFGRYWDVLWMEKFL